MALQLNPYISFKDNAREAMEFYKTIFGGKLEVSTFKDFGATEDTAEENLVMHSTLTGDRVMFMASDTPSRMEYKPGNTISMSLSGDPEEAETLRGYFEKLSVGGTVTLPFEKAMWGDTFGMVVDKYGINWLVDVLAKPAE